MNQYHPIYFYHCHPCLTTSFYLNSSCPIPSCFLHSSDSKASACNAGDLGSIPGSEDPLEEGAATHSSVLPWRIPWTEETGGLQSVWSRRVGQD